MADCTILEQSIVTGESKHGEPIHIFIDAMGDMHWKDCNGKFMEFDGASDIPMDYAEMLIQMLAAAIAKSKEVANENQ